MIIRQCPIRQRTDRNFPNYYHLTLHDIVHTQNGGLRFIENRSAHHRTKYSSVGNGKCTSCHFFKTQSTRSCFLSQLFDFEFYLMEVERLYIVYRRDNESIGSRNRDRYIHIIVIDEIVFINTGVDRDRKS